MSLYLPSVFTARRYAKERSLLLPGVGPSVCPSDTLVHCIHMAEDIVKLLVRPGTLVLHPMRRYPIPRGTLSARAQNANEKILRFSAEIATFLGNGAI